jgi:hypothetical protein
MAARLNPGNVNWQDYRANNIGMVVYYTTDPVSEVPIREIPEEIDSPVPADPNYETKTYGLFACQRPKVRAGFMKNKARYLFFMTKYAGTNIDLNDSYMVTGFYHIVKTADAKKLHIRHCSEYECLDLNSCMAFLADEVRFLAVQDALVLNEEMLKEWGYGARITRQTRILLDPEKTASLLEYLRSKPDATKAYIDETKRLQPHGLEEEEEEEEEEEAEFGSDETIAIGSLTDEEPEPSSVSLSQPSPAAAVEQTDTAASPEATEPVGATEDAPVTTSAPAEQEPETPAEPSPPPSPEPQEAPAAQGAEAAPEPPEAAPATPPPAEEQGAASEPTQQESQAATVPEGAEEPPAASSDEGAPEENRPEPPADTPQGPAA